MMPPCRAPCGAGSCQLPIRWHFSHGGSSKRRARRPPARSAARPLGLSDRERARRRASAAACAEAPVAQLRQRAIPPRRRADAACQRTGRHRLGSRIYDYWYDPRGVCHEHWTDTALLNAKAPANPMRAVDRHRLAMGRAGAAGVSEACDALSRQGERADRGNRCPYRRRRATPSPPARICLKSAAWPGLRPASICAPTAYPATSGASTRRAHGSAAGPVLRSQAR